MGETAKDGGAEGEVAINSQAKGPGLDGTLERVRHTQEAILLWAMFGRGRTVCQKENLSGRKTETQEATE